MDDAVTIPGRFKTRSLTADDLDGVFHLIVACEQAATGVADIDPEDIRTDWARPGFDLAADTVSVFEGDRVAATAEVFKNRADVNVHPEYEGLGIGAWLLDRTEERSRALGRTKVGQTLADTERGAIELLQRNGYGYGHTSWMLAIEMDARPAEPGALGLYGASRERSFKRLGHSLNASSTTRYVAWSRSGSPRSSTSGRRSVSASRACRR